jgi:ABC-2 type transport system ATP-binding protein
VSEIVLRLHDLRKTFDEGLFKPKKEVLRGVSLEIRSGEIFGFLGPNGAGKTTTIKAITGLIFPDSGEITIAGLRHSEPAAKRKIGFMPENPYYYSHLTGAEYMRFCADLLGMESAGIGRRVEELLGLVGLEKRGGDKMRTYSKGMLQRVNLAQALLNSPELLILDEPMSGLDPIGRRDLRDIILAQQQAGTTIFFSSHIIPDVETICDRVAIMIDGVIKAVGEVHEIVAQEVDLYEVTFTGVDLDKLKTETAAHHLSGDKAWVRISAEKRDALIAEVSAAGGKLFSLTPVRSTLEEFLLEQYEEVRR